MIAASTSRASCQSSRHPPACTGAGPCGQLRARHPPLERNQREDLPAPQYRNDLAEPDRCPSCQRRLPLGHERLAPFTHPRQRFLPPKGAVATSRGQRHWHLVPDQEARLPPPGAARVGRRTLLPGLAILEGQTVAARI